MLKQTPTSWSGACRIYSGARISTRSSVPGLRAFRRLFGMLLGTEFNSFLCSTHCIEMDGPTLLSDTCVQDCPRHQHFNATRQQQRQYYNHTTPHHTTFHPLEHSSTVFCSRVCNPGQLPARPRLRLPASTLFPSAAEQLFIHKSASHGTSRLPSSSASGTETPGS